MIRSSFGSRECDALGTSKMGVSGDKLVPPWHFGVGPDAALFGALAAGAV